MLLKRYTILLVLFGSGLSSGWGQSETRQVRIRIDSVFTRHDSLLVEIAGGKALGVAPGLFANCFSAYREADGVEYASKETGYGTIIESGSYQAICAITLYANQEVRKGDHLLLNTNLATPPIQSLLFDISLNGIQFTDAYMRPFYNSDEFILSINKQQEDVLKNKMVDDLHDTYELVKDRKKLPGGMRDIMEKGRFRGKSPLQVLKDAGIKDLNSFFLYVKSYPAKYVGNIYRLSESFTGWVISNSPYSAEEVKIALQPLYKNKAELSKKINEYKESILIEGHCATWGEEAVALGEKNKIAGADQLLQFALAIADEIKDTLGKASVLLGRAQVYQDKEKFKEAIAECEKVIAVTLMCKDSRNKIFKECKKQELAATIKKGYCQYNISLYKEGLSTLSEGESLVQQYRASLDTGEYNYYLQKIFEYRGWVNYLSGEYTMAIADYEKAIRINDEIGTYDSKNKNAGYYKRIGNVYKDQGNYRQAQQYYTAAENIYRGLNDKRNEYYTQVDIGEAFYYSSEYDKSKQYLSEARKGLLRLEDYNYAGYASSFIGTVYYQEAKFDSAILSHRASIELRKKGGSNSGQAWSWSQLGEIYLFSGNKKQALPAYDSSNLYYNRVPDKAGVAGNYNSVGRAFLNDENFKQAVDYFEKAKGISSKTTVEALYNLSAAWMPIDTVKARDYLLQCKKLSREKGNNNYTFYSLIDLSKLAYRNNNFAAADYYYDSVATMAKSFATGRAEAMRLDLKAYSFIYRLEVDSAIACYRRAIAIYDTIEQNTAAWERISLGDALISKGDFREAEDVLQKGVKVAGSVNGILSMGASYNAASFLYSLLGDFEKGIDANKKADSAFTVSGNEFRRATAYVSKGSLYKTKGEYKKSIESFLKADSIYKAGRTEEMRAAALNNIGVTYYHQGDYAKAIDYFNRSAKYFKAGLIDENYLLNKGNLAECYYYLGKNNEAEKILLAAFQPAINGRFNRIASGIAVVLGKIYLDGKLFAKAGQYLDTALAISTRSGEKEKSVDALVSLAKVKSAKGDDGEAEQHLQAAISIIKENYIPSMSWIALYESGLLHYRQKKMDKAIEDFKNAVEIVEKNSNNIYGGEEAKKIYRNDPRKVDLFGKLVVALQESGRVPEAWAYANRSNVTGIKELMGSMANKTGDPAKDAALEQVKALSQKTETLARKEAELKEQPQTGQVTAQLQSIVIEKEIAEKDFIRYSENLLGKYPELKENFYDNVNPVDFENYKRKLPDDMAVLLYVINDSKLLIFFLTNEKIGITPVELKNDITKTIREYSALLRLPSKATGTGAITVRSTIGDEEDNIDVSKLSFKEVSEKLYNQLISPVLANIVGKRKLCIIPNGDLSNIPFQSLGYQLPDNGFHFLIEDKVVFYTNRMKIFDDPAPAASNISSFAIFGVPDQTLKYTEKEATSIAGIMKISDGIYIRNKATEEQAKESLVQKRYIHFATHGILNYTDYNASYLKFLPAKDTTGGNNGKLTIDEIYELDIEGCELVTLSACETAVSRQKIKGWKISPANSLLRKRVRSVIATMWKVDDEATSILMDEFYRQLSAGKEKGEALRVAQEKLSKDSRYSHPYFWSPFVLYGDWR